MLLGEAIAAAAVVPVPDAPGRFRFAHALVRDALYDELSPAAPHAARTARWPRRSKRSTRPSWSRMLPSWRTTTSSPTPGGSASAARGYAVRAAERATAELAYEEAARLYEIAVEAHELEPGADPITRGELILGLGAAQASASDRARRSGHTPGPLTSRAAAGDPQQLARAALGYGGQPRRACRPTTAASVALIEEALGALGDDDGDPARAAPRSPRVRRPEAAVG